MHPLVLEAGSFTFYSYGLLIAVGILAAMAFLIVAERRELGVTFDQANGLFRWLFLAAVVGGKLFLFFEDPAGYIQDPQALLSGRGFVIEDYLSHSQFIALSVAVVVAITVFIYHRRPPHIVKVNRTP